MRKQNLEPLRMNLQLFAKEPTDDNTSGDKAEDQSNDIPDDDVESEEDSDVDSPKLAEENAALKVQIAKMKKAMDKATSDTAK